MNTRAFPNSPFLSGFERFERVVECNCNASAEGYPICNVEKTDTELHLTRALGRLLTRRAFRKGRGQSAPVRGRQKGECGNSFLHWDIAARQFLRSFVLADGIEVTGAALENGLLSIDLVRAPATSWVWTIEIKSGA